MKTNNINSYCVGGSISLLPLLTGCAAKAGPKIPTPVKVARSKRTRVMFLDPATRQEIWVGLVSGEINPKDLDRNVNKSIAKMVQRFVKDQSAKK